MSADPYAWWLSALAGENPEVSESEAQPGFYRIRGPVLKELLPVAIWWHGEADDDGEPIGDQQLVCLVGQEEVDPHSLWGQQHSTNPMSVWLRAAKEPVSEDAYRMALESMKKGGKPKWPDDAPDVPPQAKGSVMGDNLPDDPVEAIKAQLEGEEELIAGFLKTPVTTEAQANQIAPWLQRIASLGKRAEETRVREKLPFLEAGRAVDAKWHLPIAKASELIDRLKRHLKPYTDKKDREAAEARRKAEAEAQRLRDEAAKKDSPAEREELTRQAADAERDARERTTSVGRVGARVSSVKVKKAKVVDYEKAAIAMLKAGNQDLKDCIDNLAGRAVRAGITLDGIEVVEETSLRRS